MFGLVLLTFFALCMLFGFGFFFAISVMIGRAVGYPVPAFLVFMALIIGYVVTMCYLFANVITQWLVVLHVH